MTTRKRKSPEKRKGRPQPGFVSRAAGAIGQGLARHPREAFGTSLFTVLFSIIAANALWYQRGEHPSPFLSTRDPGHPAALAGWSSRGGLAPAGDVTTFRIERLEEGESLPADLAATADPALIARVQAELIRRGLMQGTPDGVPGPQTALAIRAFERAAGLAETGQPSAVLLAALEGQSKAAERLPAERPAESAEALSTAPDPVAAAILSAEIPLTTASTGAGQAARPAKGTIDETARLVMDIQKGLANIAYTNVSIDGVAGSQTRAAIRHFQKHYRLPETGEPSRAVLDKLKEIGAL